MTREEEIKNEAKLKCYDIASEVDYKSSAAYDGFVMGAKWADETMLTKACQWFENYLFDLGYPDDWCRDSPNIESGKERFIKAMKGE